MSVKRLLEGLDAFFAQKSARERAIMYLFPIIIFGSFSFFILYPSSKAHTALSDAKLKERQKELIQTKETLNNKQELEVALKELQNQNGALKAKLKTRVALNESTNQKTARIFGVEKEGGRQEFADFLADNAQTRGVTLISMQTLFAGKTKEAPQKEGVVDINISADFTKTLFYLSDIENFAGLTTVETIEISGQKELNSSIKVKIRGANR